MGSNGDDLFSAAAEDRLRAQAPLAARLRPRTLDEIVGQEHLVGPGRALRRLVEQDKLTSTILWGPPGTGKTTLALVIAATTRRAFEQLSAVTAGVKDVREVIDRARGRLGEQQRHPVAVPGQIIGQFGTERAGGKIRKPPHFIQRLKRRPGRDDAIHAPGV